MTNHAPGPEDDWKLVTSKRESADGSPGDLLDCGQTAYKLMENVRSLVNQRLGNARDAEAAKREIGLPMAGTLNKGAALEAAFNPLRSRGRIKWCARRSCAPSGAASGRSI